MQWACRLLHVRIPGRNQTKKRRSNVPIAPTLAPWLELYSGRAIHWQRCYVDHDTGEHRFDYEPATSRSMPMERRYGCRHARSCETAPRPKLVGVGSPNTLRHTISTESHRRGVPEAQIETAAGHRGDGTNKRHYRHLRPEYLSDFIDGVESLWEDVGKLTKVRLLDSNRDRKIIDLAAGRRRLR